jgi:hypothetical protein
MPRKYFIKSFIPITLFSVIMLTACYNDNEADLYGTTPTATCDLTTAVKFSTVVAPLMTTKCASSGCHSTTSKAAGINLGSYDAIKAYITSSKVTFLGSINRTSGYSSMPKGDAKMADCDIKKVESWITAAMPNN